MASFLLHTIHPPQVIRTKTSKRRGTWSFLDLDITIEVNLLAFKLSEKRDKFSFFVVRMPYLSSNILSTIFYGSIFSEILRIARFTLRLTAFMPKVSQLFIRMRTQGGNKAGILCQTKKALQR